MEYQNYITLLFCINRARGKQIWHYTRKHELDHTPMAKQTHLICRFTQLHIQINDYLWIWDNNSRNIDIHMVGKVLLEELNSVHKKHPRSQKWKSNTFGFILFLRESEPERTQQLRVKQNKKEENLDTFTGTALAIHTMERRILKSEF